MYTFWFGVLAASVMGRLVVLARRRLAGPVLVARFHSVIRPAGARRIDALNAPLWDMGVPAFTTQEVL